MQPLAPPCGIACSAPRARTRVRARAPYAGAHQVGVDQT